MFDSVSLETQFTYNLNLKKHNNSIMKNGIDVVQTCYKKYYLSSLS